LVLVNFSVMGYRAGTTNELRLAEATVVFLRVVGAHEQERCGVLEDLKL
jgi:hypothetical protein